MKVALIAPRSMLEWTKLGDIHFIVPDNKSVFFIPERKYKMLDNGTYELGQPLPTEELLSIARQLKVDEIVVPDVIMDQRLTRKYAQVFLETTSATYKLAVVPQGANPLEWVECYEKMSQLPIDVLCVPIWLQKRFGCRPAVVHYLLKHELWCWEKEHHLIGLDGLGELYCYGETRRGPLFRSVDTSLPFSRTAANLEVTFEDSKASRVPFGLPKVAYGAEKVDLLKRNIAKLLEVAHHYA